MNGWLLAAVAAGGAIGSLARYGMVGAVQPAQVVFPYGIFLVNILGGLLMGVIVEMSATKFNLTPEMRAFLTVGILGGFTTFSTFSLDGALLIQRGQWSLAIVYMIGSVVLSILALFAGLWLVRAL